MPKPRLLDLFCKAGGCTKGYQRAGFHVVGIDIEPQPNYCGDEFYQHDALRFPLEGFDAIHASPPCTPHSKLRKSRHKDRPHIDLVEHTRYRLVGSRLPYLIEGVEGTPLYYPVRLCGSAFGLDVRRHRLFESNIKFAAPGCNHDWQTPRFTVPDRRYSGLSRVVPVHGNANYEGETPLRQGAMGIDWMSGRELSHAIPPIYTEFLGRQLYAYIRASMGEAVAIGGADVYEPA